MQREFIPVKEIFILHGVYGYPEENWFPWLKAKLEKRGLKVYVPQFPTPQEQTLENWLEVFSKYLFFLNEDSIIIGHSLGTVFTFNILEILNCSIKASFLVAPFFDFLEIPEFDQIITTFLKKDFDWEKIRRNCGSFNLYSSIDDPIVPFRQGEILNKKLGGQFRVFSNAGHFNTTAGYAEFPKLLQDIEDMIEGNM